VRRTLVALDPGEVGAGPGVHGGVVRATVAEDGGHDEGRDAGHHPLRALGAVEGAARVTIAGARDAVAGRVVDADVSGPQRRPHPGHLLVALGEGEHGHRGLLEHIREHVGVGRSSPSGSYAGRPCEVVVVVGGQTSELDGAARGDGSDEVDDSHIVRVGRLGVIVSLVHDVTLGVGCLRTNGVRSIVQAGYHSQNDRVRSVEAVGGA